MARTSREVCELAVGEGLELVELQERTRHVVLRFKNKTGEVLTQILGRSPSRPFIKQDVMRTQFRKFATGGRG